MAMSENRKRQIAAKIATWEAGQPDHLSFAGAFLANENPKLPGVSASELNEYFFNEKSPALIRSAA